MSPASPGDRRVVVVTGGGGGIGAAIATELGRRGELVVTVDPLVSVDGSEQLEAPTETTAGRIVAAGGQARASAISVTDRQAVHDLFAELVADHGRLDAVVNVAGITRPTSFARGREEDWAAVLAVHLDGYRTILEEALPIMAAAGRGHILGVTSGSGWRAADAGAYACAKRAVASLTWELGRSAPPGVVVNAISPIAVTRMVTAALASAGRASGAATGGLSLGSMPAPEDLGPLGARLVADDLEWCQGEVVFAGGAEVAVIDRPHLLEVVRTEGVAELDHLVEVVAAGALVPAEAQQASAGATNPRFGEAYDVSADDGAADREPFAASAVRTCGIVAHRPEVGAALAAALERRGIATATIAAADLGEGFGGAAAALTALADRLGSLDAVVVAVGSASAGDGAGEAWQQVLAAHADLATEIRADAAWARAAADRASATGEPLRLVTLTDAATAGGRARAQAAAQLARASRRATEDRVAAFAVAVECATSVDTTAALAAHLVAHPDAVALAGAELAVGDGWLGLRSHPRPRAAIVLGGPQLPPWFDDVLRQAVTR